MPFQSIATPKPQPAGVYSVQDALPLFATFNRDSFKAATGIDAPEYDPTRDVKLWLDTAAHKPQHTHYATLATAPDGAYRTDPPHFVSFHLPVWEARTVNLPPASTSGFPVWNPQPSDAEIISGGEIASGIDPFYLSNLEEAAEIMKEVGGNTLDTWTPTPGPGDIHVQYGNDPRRAWQFTFKKQTVIVGFLLRAKYAQGVGAPGKWNLANDEPLWVPAVPSALQANYKVVPMPMRPLLENEAWNVAVVGQLMIRRTA